MSDERFKRSDESAAKFFLGCLAVFAAIVVVVLVLEGLK